MAEPLFFDCLTDAQFWSLFDTGVLHDHLLPLEVYERLERLAPDHGCYLFRWPEGMDLPSLHDMVANLAIPGEEPSTLSHHRDLVRHVTVEGVRSAIETWCGRVLADMPPEGGRIYVVALHPHPELRAGPCLEPQARDLHAMSLSELEAYLDAVLRLDEDTQADSAASRSDSQTR